MLKPPEEIQIILFGFIENKGRGGVRILRKGFIRNPLNLMPISNLPVALIFFPTDIVYFTGLSISHRVNK